MARLAFVPRSAMRLLPPGQIDTAATRHARSRFDRAKGIATDIEGSALYLEQDGGARIQLDEQGAILVRLPLDRPGRGRVGGFSGFALIEETVVRQLTAAISFGAWTLEMIDPTQKLTHVAVAANIEASGHLGWRTQAEDDASPNSGTMGLAMMRSRRFRWTGRVQRCTLMRNGSLKI